MCWVNIVGYYIVQWDSYLNSSSVAGISSGDGDGDGVGVGVMSDLSRL